MQYRWDLLPDTAGLLAEGRPEAVGARLDELLEEIRASSPPLIEVFRLRCAVVMSSWVRGARAAGADSTWLLEDHMRGLHPPGAGARPIRHPRRVLQRYLVGLGRAVRSSSEGMGQRLVREIREDLARTIQAPRSLQHYADRAGVSPGHLSRLVKPPGRRQPAASCNPASGMLGCGSCWHQPVSAWPASLRRSALAAPPC